MVLSVLHSDWLNDNAYRRFPLIDGATADLPNGLLVDLAMPVPQDLLSPDELFIKSVSGFGQGLVITVGQVSSPATILASCSVFVYEHQLNKSYPLVGQGQLDGVIGRLTIGLPEALQLAAGQTLDFTSDPGQSLIVPSCVRPALRGISGIRAVSNGQLLGTVSGGVTLVAGSNITLSVDELSGSVTINSQLTVQQSELDDDCGCGETSEPERPCIRSINGLLPDSQGNIQLLGGSSLAITPTDIGLQLDDSTSEPCCECEQLDALYQALQAVETECQQLITANNQLRSRLDTMASALSNAAVNPPPVNP